MNVVPLDTDMHHAVQALLPWYLTQRLDSEDVARVEDHLAGCPSCQAELALERRLQAAQPLSLEGDAERGLARMRELIGANAPRRLPIHRPAPRWVFSALAAHWSIIVNLRRAPLPGACRLHDRQSMPIMAPAGALMIAGPAAMNHRGPNLAPSLPNRDEKKMRNRVPGTKARPAAAAV